MTDLAPTLARMFDTANSLWYSLMTDDVEKVRPYQPCDYCGRELGHQDHTACPDGHCLDLPALPGAIPSRDYRHLRYQEQHLD